MTKAIADTKRLAAALRDCRETEVHQKAVTVVPELVKSRDTMVRIQPQIGKLEKELSFMESVMSKTTSEPELIQVVQGLQEYGE